MESLLFSRDGILRSKMSAVHPKTRESVNPWLPLRAIEASIDENVFLKSLDATIRFEDGLTVSEIFENLAPWSHIMTSIARMDFAAFLAEVRSEETLRSSADDYDVSHIELSYQSTLRPVAKYKRKNKDGVEYLFGGEPSYTGLFCLNSGWDFRAIIADHARENYDNEKYLSLNLAPLSEWAHLPVTIDKQAYFFDQSCSPLNAPFMGTGKPLTDPNHPLVRVEDKEGYGPLYHEISIEAPYPTFKDIMIDCFLMEIGFHYTPSMRDDIRDDLAERIKEIEDGSVITKSIDDISLNPSRERDASDEDIAEYVADVERIEAVKAQSLKMGTPLVDIKGEV